jgi:hypothetical protein
MPSFSIDLCLTNTGNTELGPTFLVFSNTNLSTPFATVNLSEIVESVCPYVLSGVPEYTTSIRLLNLPTGCCIDLPVSENLDLCVMCDLGFNAYSAETVSVVSVGNLTGSCENNITDYVVNWYGPDSDTEIQFTSGKGTQFDYNWIHPLTGASAVFVPGGVYNPRIESIILNGVELQEDLGVLSACFEPITVENLNCGNGNNTNPSSPSLSAYSHVFIFSNQGNSQSNLSAIFELSATTNFIAYAFEGDSVPDSLKISFSGPSYSTPLVLDYITVGGELTQTNLNPNFFPKSADTLNYFSKIINLQDTVTVLPNDYLIIEVEPSPTNPNTNWTLYLKCLETFDCTKCVDTNTPYKIVGSSITGITGSCGQLNVEFVLTGCTNQDNNNDDVFKYFINDGLLGLPLFFKSILLNQITTPDLYYSSTTCSSLGSPSGYPKSLTCFNGSGSINLRSYRPNSTTRIIEFKFQDLTDFNAYINSFLDIIQYSGSSNPSDMNYYTNIALSIPRPSGSTVCGDDTETLSFGLHPQTLTYSTGTTSDSPYTRTFTITSVTITNGTSFTECDVNCLGFVNGLVNTINIYVTNEFYDITGTTTVSSRYTHPFNQISRYTSTTISDTSEIYVGLIRFPIYSNQTFVASGSPLQNLTTLSATTCDFSTTMYQITGDWVSWRQDLYAYRVERTNPNNARDFRIMAATITNGQSDNNYINLAYGFSGNSVYASNPTYIQS